MALPPLTRTNSFGEVYWANRQNTANQDYYLVYERVTRLESELNRLETEFLWLGIILGSALISICLLVSRDQIRKRSNEPALERGATDPHTNQSNAPGAVSPSTPLSGAQQTL